MSGKRIVVLVVAFLLGLGMGGAAIYSLRSPERTVVRPIEVESQSENDRSQGRASDKNKKARPNGAKDPSGASRGGARGDSSDDPGGGAEPAPPHPPAPAGDDDDVGDDDDDD